MSEGNSSFPVVPSSPRWIKSFVIFIVKYMIMLFYPYSFNVPAFCVGKEESGKGFTSRNEKELCLGFFGKI